MSKILYKSTLILVILFFTGCTTGINEGDRLSRKKSKYLHDIGSLDNDEVIKYYCQDIISYKNGNCFFTNKRVVSYWLYIEAPEDNFVKSAFYHEIDTIYIVYRDSWSVASEITVILKDGGSIPMYLGYRRKKEELFFNHLLIEMKKYNSRYSRN